MAILHKKENENFSAAAGALKHLHNQAIKLNLLILCQSKGFWGKAPKNAHFSDVLAKYQEKGVN